MVMPNDSNEDWYARRLAELRQKPTHTEADVSSALVRPVLERVLGFGTPAKLTRTGWRAAPSTEETCRPLRLPT